jgi:hypothetical protein
VSLPTQDRLPPQDRFRAKTLRWQNWRITSARRGTTSRKTESRFPWEKSRRFAGCASTTGT